MNVALFVGLCAHLDEMPVPAIAAPGRDYSFFPDISSVKMAYLAERVAGGAGGALCRVGMKTCSPCWAGLPPLPFSALRPCCGWC